MILVLKKVTGLIVNQFNEMVFNSFLRHTK